MKLQDKQARTCLGRLLQMQDEAPLGTFMHECMADLFARDHPAEGEVLRRWLTDAPEEYRQRAREMKSKGEGYKGAG